MDLASAQAVEDAGTPTAPPLGELDRGLPAVPDAAYISTWGAEGARIIAWCLPTSYRYWSVTPLYSKTKLTTTQGLLETLQTMNTDLDPVISRWKVSVPSEHAVSQILGRDWPQAPPGTVYKVQDTSQAFRQLWSLIKVLSYSLISFDRAFSYFVSWDETGPWLLDVLLDIFPLLKRWEQVDKGQPASLIELTIDILGSLTENSRISKDLRTKAYTILIFACNDMLIHPPELLFEEEAGQALRLFYCKALLFVARGTLEDRVVARLAESKIVNELAILPVTHPAKGEDTDLAVRYLGNSCKVWMLTTVRNAQILWLGR